MHKNES